MLGLNFRQVWRTFQLMDKQEQRQVWLLLAISIINGVIQTLGVVSIMPFIALIAEPELAQNNAALLWLQQSLNIIEYSSLLILCASLSFLAILVSNSFIIINYSLSLKFFNARGHKLSSNLLSHFINQPPFQFYKRSTSELSKIIFSDIDRVIIGSQLAAIAIITDLIIFIIILALLLYLNVVTTLITVSALLITYILVYRVLSNKVNTLGKDFDALEIEVFSTLKQTLSLYKEIRIGAKQSYFIDKFLKPTQALYNNATTYHSLQFIPIQIIELLVFSIILVLASYLALNSPSTGYTITSIAVYAFAAYRIVPVLKSIFESTEELLYASPVLKGLLDELESSNTNSQPQQATKEIALYNEIRLQNISFTYPDSSRAILDDINLTISKGKITCINGPSGIGKSTTLDILLGLINPQKGEIYIDQNPLTPKNLKSWQKQIGYVPQQNKIIDGSVAENIAFGMDKEKIDYEQLKNVARLACINNLIEAHLNKGYDTPIGEGQQTLSGGEKQRIAIARALYHNPSLLILDEASNELDEETELVILNNLKHLGITVLFVSHKPSVSRFCDHTINFSQLALSKAG